MLCRLLSEHTQAPARMQGSDNPRVLESQDALEVGMTLGEPSSWQATEDALCCPLAASSAELTCTSMPCAACAVLTGCSNPRVILHAACCRPDRRKRG